MGGKNEHLLAFYSLMYSGIESVIGDHVEGGQVSQLLAPRTVLAIILIN